MTAIEISIIVFLIIVACVALAYLTCLYVAEELLHIIIVDEIYRRKYISNSKSLFNYTLTPNKAASLLVAIERLEYDYTVKERCKKMNLWGMNNTLVEKHFVYLFNLVNLSKGKKGKEILSYINKDVKKDKENSYSRLNYKTSEVLSAISKIENFSEVETWKKRCT